jgi:HK97 family phage major capsid protein
MRLSNRLRNELVRRHGADKSEAELVKKLGGDILDGRMPLSEFLQLQQRKGKSDVKTKPKPGQNSDPGSKSSKLWQAARVKDAGERLSTKTFTLKNRDGNPIQWGGKTLETTSEFAAGVTGVWFKKLLQRSGVPVVLTDFEKCLLAEHIEKGRWVGDAAGVYYGGGSATDYVPNATVKSLLDDTISGGLFLAPVEFDSNIITLPLLSGELFPLVDVVPVTGRRIMSATVQNLSLAWGVAGGTPIQPFNTSGLVSEFSTPVFPLSGAIEIGNDLMSDSPVQIGNTAIGLYGERLKTELDRVIVVGDGVTQPLGLLNSVGLTNVTTDAGAGGPPTVSDYESLLFAVPKQYREKSWNPVFVANDASYRRARGIPVGPGDERRVFGMTHNDYTLLDHPYKIQNDLPNSRILFGCMSRYRMYQRLGSEVVVERGGRQLALTNTTLIVIRSRFGGQPVDGQSFAATADAQS